jgi:hypothetical protein
MFLNNNTLCVALIWIGLIGGHLTAKAYESATLSGIVLDSNDSRIPGIMITVRSAQHDFHSLSNNEGAFNFNFPAGVYQVEATSNNTLPYKRAPIEFRRGAYINLILRPTFRAPSDQALIHDPVVHSREINRLVLLQYSKESDGAHGPKLFWGPDLMLTLGASAVYADRLACSNDWSHCCAAGRVKVEQQLDVSHGEYALVDTVQRGVRLVTDKPTLCQ